MKNTRYTRLRGGQKRRAGYQYRYKDARGWTPWMNGEDEAIGVTTPTAKECAGFQFRAPRVRKR